MCLYNPDFISGVISNEHVVKQNGSDYWNAKMKVPFKMDVRR